MRHRCHCVLPNARDVRVPVVVGSFRCVENEVARNSHKSPKVGGRSNVSQRVNIRKHRKHTQNSHTLHVDGWSKMRKIHFVAEIFTFASLFSHIHCHHMWCHFLLEHRRRASKLSRTHVFIVVEDAERHPTAVRRENEYKNNTRKIIFTEWMRTSKNKNSLIRICTCMRSSRSSLTRCDLCDFIATPTAVAYWKLRVRKPKIAGQIKWLKIDD